MIQEISWVLCAMTVADAIKAGEIGRGLGCGDNVIDAHGIGCVGKGNFNQLRTEMFTLADGGFDFFTDPLIHSIDKIFARDSDFDPLEVAAELGGEILCGQVE